MGACFQSVRFHECTKDILREWFTEYQEEQCYDYGHDTYAGHLGIKEGLVVHDEIVESAIEARDFIDKRDEKWGPAHAVRYHCKDGTIGWFVGGWCAE